MQNMSFGHFVNMTVIKNNNIYIFANFSAILNLCKLDNHLMERCGSENKLAFENIFNYH